jgi:GT2 family glycosyltransferase
MKECLDSILSQSYKNLEIIIADNNSENNTLDLISKKYLIQNQADGSTPEQENLHASAVHSIKLIKSDKNLGLGEAINMAIKHASGDYILVSSFDAVYDKIAVEELVDSIYNLDSRYIGLAPKIKLYYQKEYIESVGVYIDNNFYLGYNGIGQLDLDQYDKPEDVFGLSFTSAFLKKDYLSRNVLGTIDKPVDGSFFLFYEDIDFCYRANLLGYKFRSCPTAVCYHKYAYSFRDEETAFERKYYYQKLNVLKLVSKNAERSNMSRVIKNELGIQSRT